MRWQRKKPDLVSERELALNAEIESLEAQIKQLDEELLRAQEHPRLRSTAVPHGETISHPEGVPTGLDSASGAAIALRGEPVFEEISQERIKVENEMPNAPEHFNEFGVRKFDFPTFVNRVRHFFTGPSTSNPKLVSYLAAGGVHGLRPLRKERRVARNRFLFWSTLLFLTLVGTLWWFIHSH